MLSSLKACQTRDDLASLLGYKASALTYILYQVPDQAKYTPFLMKKKDGSDRQILAPNDKLKVLQAKVSDLLYSCIEDIKFASPKRFSSLSGFSRKQGIYENAKRHCGSRYVFNIDLEDFFPSIHIGRIMGFLMKDQSFMLTREVALTLGQIACHSGTLPQGSPCSPVISNLIGSLLDARLARFARHHGCRYSRYADDITFSTNQREFPSAVAVIAQGNQGWIAADELTSRISSAGYGLNTAKTRMSVRASRQMATGLVVNRTPNVTAEYYKRTRAMCHRAFVSKTAYAHRFFDDDSEEINAPASMSYIEGRLSHIYAVRSKSDTRDLKTQQDKAQSYFQLYRDFLLFKTFYKQDRPLIITEGESDRVYLRLAARALFDTTSPFLYDDNGTEKLAFRTQNYTKRLAEVVSLSGGTGNIIKTLGSGLID